jgi:tetratricopeptide (TPR) repeat protein
VLIDATGKGVIESRISVFDSPKISFTFRCLLGDACDQNNELKRSRSALQRGLTLEPARPIQFPLALMGFALFIAGRYQEALECTEKALRENSSLPGIYRLGAACLSQMGRVDEAKAALAYFLRLVPDANVASTKAQLPLKSSIEALKRAGLPDS